MIQFGLRLHDAEQLPMEQLLPLVKEKGFTSGTPCPQQGNGRSIPADPTP